MLWGAALPALASHKQAIARSDESARSLLIARVRQGQLDGSISPEMDADAFSVAFLEMIRGMAAQLLTVEQPLLVTALRAEVRRFIQLVLAPR